MTVDKKKISAKTRKKEDKREADLMPAVLYGAKRKSTSLLINKKDFVKLYNEAGESTLVDVDIDKKEKSIALIYEVQRNSLTGEIIHADFFEPNLKEEVEAEIPLVFKGEAPAVKDFDGTLVRNMYSVDVKALPENLPHEIEVNVEKLKTLDDVITIADLNFPKNVEVLHEKENTVVLISRPENVEEELEKPIEEGEEAEVIGEKEREEKKEEEEENKEEKKEE